MINLPLLKGGVALKIKNMNGVLGGSIWPAAIVLCQYIGDHIQFETASIIELGSGTGAVGLFAAGRGASVTLTEHKPPTVAVRPMVAYSVDGMPEDYDQVHFTSSTSDRLLNLLQENVNLNSEHFVHTPQVLELDWTNQQHLDRIIASEKDYNWILASDVTYTSHLHDALSSTIAKLLINHDSAGTQRRCLIAHERRVLNLYGMDHQLESFQTSLAHRGLMAAEKCHRRVQDRHEVTILEIQQEKV